MMDGSHFRNLNLEIAHFLGFFHADEIIQKQDYSRHNLEIPSSPELEIQKARSWLAIDKNGWS